MVISIYRCIFAFTCISHKASLRNKCHILSPKEPWNYFFYQYYYYLFSLFSCKLGVRYLQAACHKKFCFKILETLAWVAALECLNCSCQYFLDQPVYLIVCPDKPMLLYIPLNTYENSVWLGIRRYRTKKVAGEWSKQLCHLLFPISQLRE